MINDDNIMLGSRDESIQEQDDSKGSFCSRFNFEVREDGSKLYGFLSTFSIRTLTLKLDSKNKTGKAITNRFYNR